MALFMLQGCVSVPTASAPRQGTASSAPPAGFFLPVGTFGTSANDVKPGSVGSAAIVAPPVPPVPPLPPLSVPGVAERVAPAPPPPPKTVTAPMVPAPLAVPLAVSQSKTLAIAQAVERASAATQSNAILPSANNAPVAGGSRPPALSASAPFVAPVVSAPPASDSSGLQVVVYASPSTKAYFTKVGMNSGINTQVWSVFLAKYRIPFQVISSVDKLESISARVLILPSSIALSEREKQAVIVFRASGGSVLSSWLVGSRSENGADMGFGFMEKVLDVKVVGSTESDIRDDFMLPHGDSPVTHYLPAGTRVWLDRIKGLYPLRLEGGQTAAQIMDWSRTPVFGKQTSTIVFDERRQSSGRFSRSVALGYPEQLWPSADPKQLEAIAHNALMWLLRQPAAYVTAWPHPYSSAFVMAVDMAGAVSDTDLAYAKLLEASGGRGTYYVLGDSAGKSSNKLNRLKAAGHEVAYLGDTYTDFRGHPEAVQARRLDSMRKSLKDAGVEVAVDAGFHAPMDSYDKTTEMLLKAGGFGHLLAANDVTDSQLPFFASARDSQATTGAGKPMVILPRTQNAPEDSVDNCQPEVGLKPFLNELALSENRAGLSVVSISGKSELTDAQSAEIFSYLNARRERMWLTTAGQVADWWRERERVSVRLEQGGTGPRLVVSVLAGAALRQASVVALNLPERGGSLRLVARGNYEKAPRIARLDAWRAGVVLDAMTAGEYQWDLFFDPPELAATK